MQAHASARDAGLPAAPAHAAALRQRLHPLLAPLRERLDAPIDARWVRTLLSAIALILLFRHRHHRLLLSEWGGYLLVPQQAPAATKRLSNLLCSPPRTSEIIAHFLWQGAQLRRQEWAEGGEEALLLWDESVPQSLAAEGLCAVGSSKAARRKPSQPGYYHPPGGQPAAEGAQRSADGGGDAGVEHKRRAGDRRPQRAERTAGTLCGVVGPPPSPRLGSRLGRHTLLRVGVGRWRALCAALAQA